MSTEIKERYSDADLAEFKTLILEKIRKAQEQLDLYKSAYVHQLFSLHYPLLEHFPRNEGLVLFNKR